MWSVIRVEYNQASHLAEYLKEGWEPFAVTVETNTGVATTNYLHFVWLRKKEA